MQATRLPQSGRDTRGGEGGQEAGTTGVVTDRMWGVQTLLLYMLTYLSLLYKLAPVPRLGGWVPVTWTGAHGRSRWDTLSLRCPWGAHRQLCVWVWAEVMCRPLSEQMGVDLLRARERGLGPGACVLITGVNRRLPLMCLPRYSRCPFTQEAPCWVTSHPPRFQGRAVGGEQG